MDSNAHIYIYSNGNVCCNNSTCQYCCTNEYCHKDSNSNHPAHLNFYLYADNSAIQNLHTDPHTHMYTYCHSHFDKHSCPHLNSNGIEWFPHHRGARYV